MSITVRVIRVPGTMKEFGLPDGATLQDALTEMGTTIESTETVKVNGADVDMTAVLPDNAAIVIAKGAKGAYANACATTLWFMRGHRV